MKKNKEIKQCSRCVLDSGDYPDIQLDNQGVCDICRIYDKLAQETVLEGEVADARLQKMISNVKNSGKGKEYDCLLGVSGGVDSTYLAYLVKNWGLRPLIVHVDNGWNTELAVSNIESFLKKLDLDLYTYVLDWSEMKDVQLAFFKASVVDIDLPFDNTFMAVLYKLARKHKIKYILSGHNTVTEGWLPPNFNHHKLDKANIKDIHKKYGETPLKNFPLINMFQMKMIYSRLYGIENISPLNYVRYNKDEVKEFITKELGWRDYGGKHYENIFTRFYQGYILPEKFGIDKRKAHLSTLICSGQISKEEALLELEKAPYENEELLKEDKEYFIKKMGLTETEFEEIMARPPVEHTDYKSYLNLVRKLKPVKKIIKKIIPVN